jgi:phosphoribosylaminoimidazole-succinocarboxamide synthase
LKGYKLPPGGKVVRKLDKLYEGKAKIVYTTDQPGLLIQYFKDSATAFNGKKKGTIEGKGAANVRISAYLFEILEKAGIKTHYHRLLTEREMLIDRLEMIPLEAIVRNIAAGSLSERLGYEEGRRLKKPIVEFYYKRDDLGDPLLACQHVLELGLVDGVQFQQLRTLSLQVNDVLQPLFAERGLELVDFKLEFGFRDSEIILGDEISPDTCRLWDKKTGERLDKDRFRRDLRRVEEAYQEVLKRLASS